MHYLVVTPALSRVSSHCLFWNTSASAGQQLGLGRQIVLADTPEPQIVATPTKCLQRIHAGHADQQRNMRIMSAAQALVLAIIYGQCKLQHQLANQVLCNHLHGRDGHVMSKFAEV